MTPAWVLLPYQAVQVLGSTSLYAAAMLAAALFLILRDLPKGDFPFRIFFGLAAGGLLLVSAMVFTKVDQSAPAKLDLTYLTKISVVLFTVSLTLSFLVTLVDLVRSTPIDPTEYQAETDAAFAQSVKEIEEDE